VHSPVPSLAPRLAVALKALRDGGVEPTDAEIVWLGKLRHKADNPCDGSVPWVMGAPVEYGGMRWYPMHRLAESWFLRAFKLLDGNDVLQIAAFLFAHAYSGAGDKTVREYMTDEAIREKLDEWRNDLPVHDDQVAALCDTLRDLDGQQDSVPDVRDDSEDGEEVEAVNTAHSIASFCKAFPGVSPEFWLTDISSADSMQMLSAVGSDGGWAESPIRREAVANWLRAVKWVWRNHQDGE
jgi:hypothetical protein